MMWWRNRRLLLPKEGLGRRKSVLEIMASPLPSSMSTPFVNTSGFPRCAQILLKIETYQPGRQLTIAHLRKKISSKGLDFSKGNAVCCYKWLPMVVDGTKISVTCTQ
jgi:hypothetical protein